MRVLYLICCGFFVASNITMAAEKSFSYNSYTSVFDSYQNWEPESFGDWRLANDTVGEIGGWQFYSREHSIKKQSNPADLGKSDLSRGVIK